ncbi:MAG: 1,4-alpha-glucan branching protein GlgB [Eubacteriales bacterium]|nr:1,4-alpha-glucan branching protein GlgB [Eubacteriales bacterium]MDD3611141.1 1,4-alpha-glucan branching protein GlgB [Eubacteriales bacterium]
MNQAYLFNNGKNYQSYKMLGSRPDVSAEGERGYRFAVWAPRAAHVSVVGDFNGWDPEIHTMAAYGTTGIWHVFIPDAIEYQRYKYAIRTPEGRVLLKADPYARHAETRPNTASILYDAEDDYDWQDADFRANRQPIEESAPLNIYEIHLGSWRRYADGNTFSYRDIAPQLASYVKEMGYNAVEIMPIMEHPLDASWGYQISGYFAPTSRYGKPSDLKFLIDTLHQHGIKVILDWVPGHFPRDDFGLANFDGKPLYEYADSIRSDQPNWGTLVFDFSLAEVRSFLLSNAWYWLDEFNVDGLRVDAVSSIVYLNFGREYSASARNVNGGYENLEAISFIQELNTLVRENFPYAIMAAEESSTFPNVTKAAAEGGLGFSHKWNMGWMNDTLQYMTSDYYARGQFHDKITFSMMYSFSERFILPFSHDEVVHGKKSLLGRMPGDYWRQFASLRTCYMYQMSFPGSKLNFMGNEFAPFIEWRYYEELEWFLLQYPNHKGMFDFVRNLNHIYLEYPALWEVEDSWDGFEWIASDDRENSIFAYARYAEDRRQTIIAVLNMTPASYKHYKLNVPHPGRYKLLLNSDDSAYQGSSYAGLEQGHTIFWAKPEKEKRQSLEAKMMDLASPLEQEVGDDSGGSGFFIEMPLPPLAGLYLLYEGEEENK